MGATLFKNNGVVRMGNFIDIGLELANRRVQRIIENEMFEIFKNFGFVQSYKRLDDYTFEFTSLDSEFFDLLMKHQDRNSVDLRKYVLSANPDCARAIDELYASEQKIFEKEVKKIFGERVITPSEMLNREDN